MLTISICSPRCHPDCRCRMDLPERNPGSNSRAAVQGRPATRSSAPVNTLKALVRFLLLDAPHGSSLGVKCSQDRPGCYVLQPPSATLFDRRSHRAEIARLRVGDLHQNRGFDSLRVVRKGERKDALAIHPTRPGESAIIWPQPVTRTTSTAPCSVRCVITAARERPADTWLRMPSTVCSASTQPGSA